MSLFSPKCKLVTSSTRYPEISVRHIEHTIDCLDVYIQGPNFSYACVRFKNPVGIRILEERDLVEFWEKYNEKNGWLYQVVEGGWLDLEKTRGTFSSPSIMPNLKEYLLVDDNCISVLCMEEPEIRNAG